MIHIQSACIYRINIQAVCMQQEKKTNKARSEQTRAVLIDAARGLFASAGYAETSTPDIVRAAGVTRGALYHHFEDKEALFAAVVTAEFQQVAADIDASGQEAAAPVAALMAGSRAFLQAMQVPGRVRLLLLDGPAVLGRAEVDRIDRATSADTLRTGLEAAMAQGEIRSLPIEALTVQLSALFDRAALAVAEGEDPEVHLLVLEALFAGLRPGGGKPRER